MPEIQGRAAHSRVLRQNKKQVPCHPMTTALPWFHNPSGYATVSDRIHTGDCWTWTGATNGAYPTIYHEGRTQLAHRVIYVDLTGIDLTGLDLDHRCRNKLCVNPDHLDPVPHITNTRRDHRRHLCKHGHPLTPENRIGGKGACRECNRAAQRRWRGAQKSPNA